MRVLITGASGFVGSHLLELLKNSGDELFGTYSGNKTRLAGVDDEHQMLVDLTDQQGVDSLIQTVKPERIYHLASIAFGGNSFDNPQQLLHNNIQLQANVFSSVQKFAPTARVLVISSAEVYGRVRGEELPITESQELRPANPYGVSKAAQEMLSLAYQRTFELDVVVARPFNHIGKGQHELFVVPNFLSQLRKIRDGEQSEMKVGNLESARDYLDVKDVVAAYVLLMEKGVSGEIYNIASGSSIKTGELLEILIQSSDVHPKVIQDPQRVRKNEVPEVIGSSSKLRKLGWKPKYQARETLKLLGSEL